MSAPEIEGLYTHTPGYTFKHLTYLMMKNPTLSEPSLRILEGPNRGMMQSSTTLPAVLRIRASYLEDPASTARLNGQHLLPQTSSSLQRPLAHATAALPGSTPHYYSGSGTMEYPARRGFSTYTKLPVLFGAILNVITLF